MDNIELTQSEWVAILHDFCDAVDPRLTDEQNLAAAMSAAEVSSTVAWMIASGFTKQVLSDLARVVTPGDPSETIDAMMKHVRENFAFTDFPTGEK